MWRVCADAQICLERAHVALQTHCPTARLSARAAAPPSQDSTPPSPDHPTSLPDGEQEGNNAPSDVAVKAAPDAVEEDTFAAPLAAPLVPLFADPAAAQSAGGAASGSGGTASYSGDFVGGGDDEADDALDVSEPEPPLAVERAVPLPPDTTATACANQQAMLVGTPGPAAPGQSNDASLAERIACLTLAEPLPAVQVEPTVQPMPPSEPLPVPSTVGARELVAAPSSIVAPLKIRYARTPKRIDMRVLKGAMWTSLVSHLDTNVPLDVGSEHATEPTKGQHEGALGAGDGPESASVPFQTLLDGLGPEGGLPPSQQREASVHLAFICLLHLANEHGLELHTTSISPPGSDVRPSQLWVSLASASSPSRYGNKALRM